MLALKNPTDENVLRIRVKSPIHSGEPIATRYWYLIPYKIYAVNDNLYGKPVD